MTPRPSLVVQCLGFGAPNAGGWDQSLVRELDSVCLQLKSLHAQGKLGITRTTTKTQNSQKNTTLVPLSSCFNRTCNLVLKLLQNVNIKAHYII